MLLLQVVHYEGQYYATARTAYMKVVNSRWWWFNGGYLCRSKDANFSSPSCTKFDPWLGDFKECLWSGLVDTKGIEDPKLFVWPGKGLYALFGRKPAAVTSSSSSSQVQAPSPICSMQQPWLQQYLVSIKVQGEAGPWTFKTPVPLKVTIPGFYNQQIKAKSVIKEKNWMPLVYKDQLYMVHRIHPEQRILKLESDGLASEQLMSNSSAVLAQFADFDVHGGPPVIHIPKQLSPSNSSYYLGVLHYFKWDKTAGKDIKYYFHYAYKMQDKPPFAICAVSKEIPLVFLKHRRRMSRSAAAAANSGQDHQRPKAHEDFKSQRIWKDTSHTAFVSGLFLDTNPTPMTGPSRGKVVEVRKLVSSNAAAAAPVGSESANMATLVSSSQTATSSSNGAQLLISYGCSDVDSRMLRLTLEELELLFEGQQQC